MAPAHASEIEAEFGRNNPNCLLVADVPSLKPQIHAYPTPMRYDHLTHPDSFDDDLRVGVVAAPSGIALSEIPRSSWAWIPERLFQRAILLGQAYSLHFGSIVNLDRDTELNSVQCEDLLEQIEFMASLVDDQALLETLRSVAAQVTIVIRNPDRTLVLSPQ